MTRFEVIVAQHGITLKPVTIDTLWINITRRCNQMCRHCHLAASPLRTEEMSWPVMARCLEILSQHSSINTVDITGGAPELHPYFDRFVTEARELGKQVKVRTNLTVVLDGDPLTGTEKHYLPQFFAEKGVELIASLPHYEEAVTDAVRGPDVFRKSLQVIRQLNAVGYADAKKNLILNLVHNVSGPLTRTQRDSLEAEFREQLAEYGLAFNRLYTVTNMPIGRFGAGLRKTGEYQTYLNGLTNSFDAEAVAELVCRTLVSVGYDGRLYDCDFNQAVNLQIKTDEAMNVFNFDLERLLNRSIRLGNHCFGCTAGGGSN